MCKTDEGHVAPAAPLSRYDGRFWQDLEWIARMVASLRPDTSGGMDRLPAFIAGSEVGVVLRAAAEDVGLGFDYNRVFNDHERAFHQTLRKGILWAAATSEAIQRAEHFERLGYTSLSRHWYAAAQRRKLFMIETQANAIALASR